MNGLLSKPALFRELEPVIEERLGRHLATAVTWDLADYVRPDFFWGQRQSTLTETTKAALVTTLLGHNNTARSAPQFVSRSAWSRWNDEWAAEKRLHAEAIQQYLMATRSVDPIALERARFQCMTVGIESSMEGDHLLRSVAHATVDVMAAMVSHRNTAAQSDDPVAVRLLERIIADQELHVAFHRDVTAAALDLAPAQTVKVITEVVMNFQMPGSGLNGFERSAMLLVRDGIYDARRHLDDVVLPALRAWRIFERTDLGAGERSRDVLATFLDDLSATATVPQLRSRRREDLRAS